MAWTHNQLATVARKHKLQTLAERHLQSVQKIPGLRTKESFVCALEAVRLAQELSPDDFKGQLDAINTINLQLYDQIQVSCLKNSLVLVILLILIPSMFLAG